MTLVLGLRPYIITACPFSRDQARTNWIKKTQSVTLAAMYEYAALEVRQGFPLGIETGPSGIRKIEFASRKPASKEHSPLMRETLRQLRAYFSGKLHHFDLPLALAGREFKHGVGRALQTFPYGQPRP